MPGLRIGWKQRLEMSRRGKNECWPWQAAALVNGYGYVRTGKTFTPAHRIVYEYITGKKIPAGHHIDHLCRNKACVNPAHLEAVPPRVNFLRGESFAAKNHRKTHCKRGHDITDPASYYLYARKGCASRRCLQCARIDNAASRARRKAREAGHP